MKIVMLICDSCGREMRGKSADLTLFDGDQRRDFCTQNCFRAWVEKFHKIETTLYKT